MIEIQDNFTLEPGKPYNLGATMDHRGCNFALFSRNATSVELVFFNKEQDNAPSHRFVLDPVLHKTGDVWHVYLQGVLSGQLYGYLVDGPFDPWHKGHRFNRHKLLVDPYAKAVVGQYNWRSPAAYSYIFGHPHGDASFSNLTNWGQVAKGAVVDDNEFDWGRDKSLHIPMKDTVIYEVSLRGFTRSPTSGVAHPGTYLGMIEKIPYLKNLGITTVELLPVQDFNPFENVKTNPETGAPLVNFWGYSTLNFFSPARWFSSDGDGRTAVTEFKTMVKAFHEAGIEVILDVVYNHTGEGNEYGPTHSLKGLDNRIYYMLEQGRYYKNYSGCGNTLNCNHPVVKRLILDSLRYWVVDMHVDGFRFDLAAILGRDEQGHWMPNHSVLNEIAHDPILSRSQIIAEGWDAAGLFKVGGFPLGWAEWNSHFRDGVRSFIKSDPQTVGEVAKRLSGSSDLFEHASRSPFQSINFITAHDGFTLRDLVSYNGKNNTQNAEENRDGNDHNLSWNCGAEGPSSNKDVETIRLRQMKNFILTLMVSQGTPMILSGDEVQFSKDGNNNTYCHDNKLNWLDWDLQEKNKEYFEFCRQMIHFRLRHPCLRREFFFQGRDLSGNKLLDIDWMGVDLWPDWGSDSHCLAFMLDGSKAETGALVDDNIIYVAFNTFWEVKNFQLPRAQKNQKWYLVADTAKIPGIWEDGKEPLIETEYITVQPRTSVILLQR